MLENKDGTRTIEMILKSTVLTCIAYEMAFILTLLACDCGRQLDLYCACAVIL